MHHIGFWSIFGTLLSILAFSLFVGWLVGEIERRFGTRWSLVSLLLFVVAIMAVASFAIASI